jgi:4-amino-4-deoxy-L-arabinose transferase-like glycosyltransferase
VPLRSDPVSRALTALAAVVCAAMFLRLSGFAPALPDAPLLVVALLAVLGAKAVLERRAAGTLPGLRALTDRWGFPLVVVLIVVLGTAVRLASIGADLGHQPLDIDEHRVASNVKQFFVEGTVGYHTVEHYPGILFWLLTGSSLLVYLHGLMEGAFASVRGMPLEDFVLAGRLTSTAIAAATTAIVAMLGRQLGGPGAGLLSAGLFALSPLSVQTTTALRNDPAQVMFICAAVHASLASLRSDRWQWPVLAGLFAGLATAIKYTSVFAVAAVVLATVLGSAPRRAARALLATVAFAAAVLITNHFLWSDFPNFVRQLSDQVIITGPEHWGAVENPAAFHTAVLQRSGIGWIAMVVAAAAGIHGLVTGRPHAWVFWAVPLLYSWFTTKRPSQFPRWVFPLLPFVVVAASVGLVQVMTVVRTRVLADRSRAWLRPATAIALAGVVLAQPLWNGVANASRRFTEPSHARVERWLASRPAGERVLLGAGWLELAGTSVVVTRVRDLGATLDGSMYRLAAYDWIVVPEPLFGRPSLKALSFTERIRADHWSFGGNLGYDYEIYAPPRIPEAPGEFALDLTGQQGAEYLGLEWSPADAGGRRVPAGGATIYVPPRPATKATLTLDLVGPIDEPALIMSDAGGQVPLPQLSAPGPQRIQVPVRLAENGRSTELRLSPARRNTAVRILSVKVD